MLILASSSPQRKRLLEEVNIPFRMEPSDYEEIVNPEETPEENAKRFALGKAMNIAKQFPNDIILGVDTLVVIRGEVTGKPKDEAEARVIIKKLLNTSHSVISGIALVTPKTTLVETETTIVEFGDMTDEEFEHFVQNGFWKERSGAFTIEKHGALFIKGIQGDYYNVVGLPLYRMKQMMRQL